MNEVVDVTPCSSVQVDGDACEFRQELMRITLDLASVRLRMKARRRNMSVRDMDRLEEAGRMLDAAIRLLTAIDEATTGLEDQAADLLKHMSDGASACFRRQDTSVGIGVDGIYSRRQQTLRINRFFVAQPMPSIYPRGNDNTRVSPKFIEAVRARQRMRASSSQR